MGRHSSLLIMPHEALWPKESVKHILDSELSCCFPYFISPLHFQLLPLALGLLPPFPRAARDREIKVRTLEEAARQAGQR